jgi:MFS family permease
MFRGRLLPLTLAVTFMHAFTSFAWWGFNLWVPAFLSLPVAQGGIGLSPYVMAGLVAAMYVGQWFGYTTFGYASDRYGRRTSSVVYIVASAVFVLAYAATRNPLVLLLLGPPAAFFGSGHISGFGAVTAEIYPTRIRARAQGFTYNIGRVAAAAAPFTVGSLAQTHGFQLALSVTAGAYLLSALLWIAIPETKGKPLQ